MSGIEEGSLLEAKQSAILTVTVKYNNVTEQPDNLTADLEVTLDYSQAPDGYIPPVPSESIGGQDVELVESGSGLYEDTYEPGRLIYRGVNPNNYIEFNGELWRIVAKETDGTYKIIRNDVLEKRPYDEVNHRSTANNTFCTDPSFGCGVYAAVEGEFSTPDGAIKGTVTEDSSIKIYLNEDYYVNDINSTAKGQMISHTFNIGAVKYLNNSGADSIEKNIAGEKMYTWTGNVGLINVSDILKASTNPLCTSVTNSYDDFDACNSNYLLDSGSGTASSLYYWTINADSSTTQVWAGASLSTTARIYFGLAINPNTTRPVVFLKADTILSGSGTSSDPYKIVQ